MGRTAPATASEAPPPTRRAELRAATIAEIKGLARAQLAEHRPGGLSLREISRQMRMTSSALYRYFSSAEELIGALCVDAYDSLADALTAARDAQPSDDPTSQFWAIGQAYRHWSLEQRSDFALIFGTPMPGYSAPEELTGPAAGSSLAPALDVYAAAVAAGAADPDRSQIPETVQGGELLPWLLADRMPGYPARLAAITLSAWASLLGYLVAEIFGSLSRLVEDTSGLYRAHLRGVMQSAGFLPSLVDALQSAS